MAKRCAAVIFRREGAVTTPQGSYGIRLANFLHTKCCGFQFGNVAFCKRVTSARLELSLVATDHRGAMAGIS